jgi:hypothetical protein
VPIHNRLQGLASLLIKKTKESESQMDQAGRRYREGTITYSFNSRCLPVFDAR